MITFLRQEIVSHFHYWVYVVIMMLGLYAMIAKCNLVKKLMGMAIFQTAIILFYVSIAVKSEATIPIYYYEDIREHAAHAGGARKNGAHENGEHDNDVSAHGSTEHDDDQNNVPHHEIDAARYANPLPHVLMLTAIVVGVATLGVGLAIVQKAYKQYGTVEENEILAIIQKDPHQHDAVHPEGYRNI